MTRTILFALGLGILGARVCAACTPTTLGATAAESAYTADLLRCVDQAKTLQESRDCRVLVDAKWAISETATKDGGR